MNESGVKRFDNFCIIHPFFKWWHPYLVCIALLLIWISCWSELWWRLYEWGNEVSGSWLMCSRTAGFSVEENLPMSWLRLQSVSQISDSEWTRLKSNFKKHIGSTQMTKQRKILTCSYRSHDTMKVWPWLACNTWKFTRPGFLFFIFLQAVGLSVLTLHLPKLNK